MAVEDGATFAVSLSRAETVDEIPKAMRVYEAIRKPKTEKLQNASAESGVEKHYPDCKKQRERDAQMKIVMSTHLAKISKRGEKNSYPSAWVTEHDAVGYVNTFEYLMTSADSLKANIKLDKVFREKKEVAP
jgi:hypothetical protein